VKVSDQSDIGAGHGECVARRRAAAGKSLVRGMGRSQSEDDQHGLVKHLESERSVRSAQSIP
jgi:hypothetical protein